MVFIAPSVSGEMKIIKQKHTLPVTNLDIICGDGIHEKSKHGALFPTSIRAIICGPSACGKSNVMLSLLLNENGLKFRNLYIYSKSLYQPKYQFLERALKGIVNYYAFQNNCDVISPNEAKNNSVAIFDDVSCHEQDKIREYFCMGRHRKIDSFYLTQTYTRVPKHLIRDNANFIILFKQDEMNLKHVYQDHVGTDMTYEQFHKLCSQCWKTKYGFITISKDTDLNNGRYRQNLDKYVML